MKERLRSIVRKEEKEKEYWPEVFEENEVE